MSKVTDNDKERSKRDVISIRTAVAARLQEEAEAAEALSKKAHKPLTVLSDQNQRIEP